MKYGNDFQEIGLRKNIFSKPKKNIINNSGTFLVFIILMSLLIGCNRVEEKTYHSLSVPIILNAKRLTIKYAPDLSSPIVDRSTKKFLYQLENWAHKRFYLAGDKGEIELIVTKAFLRKSENFKSSFKPVLTGVLNVSLRSYLSKNVSHMADFKIEQELESVFSPSKCECAILEKNLGSVACVLRK